MKPAKRSLTIYQASTFYQPFQWKANGVPVDLTGYTFRLWIKAKVTDAVRLAELTTENGGMVLIDAATGRFAINAEKELTVTLRTRQCVYDLLAIAPNGDSYRLLEGSMIVEPAVTL